MSRDIRLPPLRVHEWQGLVFVALERRTSRRSRRSTPASSSASRRSILRAMRYLRRETYDIDCNWKVYIDNFLEGYHLPHVHPGLCKVLDYRAYDTELFPWQILQSSPLRDSGEIYGEGEAFYYQIYPNIMLNIMPGRLQTNRVLPLGPDRCRVEFDFYYAQDDKAQSRIARDAGVQRRSAARGRRASAKPCSGASPRAPTTPVAVPETRERRLAFPQHAAQRPMRTGKNA